MNDLNDDNYTVVRHHRFSYLTFHADLRLQQRTRMTSAEIAHLLDQGICVKLGHQAGSYRQHLLFYSPKDAGCFVAIQDTRMGKIITILPLEYHKNLAWQVSELDCQQAKQSYDTYERLIQTLALILFVINTKNTPTPKKHPPPKKVKRFIVNLLHIDYQLTVKQKTLLKINAETYLCSVMLLLKDPAFFAKLDQKIAKSRVQLASIFCLQIINKEHDVLKEFDIAPYWQALDYMKHYCQCREQMYQKLATYQPDYLLLTYLPALPPATIKKDHTLT